MVHREEKLPINKRKSLKLVLKRSEENSMGTTETIWIGRLTNKHKLTISNINQPICSDIMNEVQRILAAQYPDVNGLQQTEKSPVWDEAENKWKYARKFTNERSPPHWQFPLGDLSKTRWGNLLVCS